MNVSYRAKVVEGKSLIDIVDDCLHGDDLNKRAKDVTKSILIDQ